MLQRQIKNIMKSLGKESAPSDLQEFFEKNPDALVESEVTIGMNPKNVFNASEYEVSLPTLHSMNFDVPDSEPSPPQDSGHRYEMLHVLGQGGMATVWKMHDAQLRRSVALKQLHQHRAESTYEQENFIVEAQVTAQLQHPGIVPIHDLQIDDEHGAHFTMREIKGHTFEEIIHSVHRVSDTQWNTTHDGWNLRRLIETLIGLLKTLSYAHSHGVIHQDIKPTNIMIGSYGEVLLVDWGIARLQSLYRDNPTWVSIDASPEFLEHRKTSVAGTPRYMAPEQIHGDPSLIDGRTDIYALGVMLFHILTKSKPFQGSVEEILNIKSEKSTSIRQWVAENTHILPIPQELCNICERAIAFNPGDRYSSAQEMQKALQSWLDGREQEERAKTLIHEVNRLQRSIQHLHFEESAYLEQLNSVGMHENHITDDWWEHWESVQELRQQIDSINDLIHQKIQGAAIYAPNLPEVSKLLLSIEYQDYRLAILEQNHRAITTGKRRFESQLAHLSSSEQAHWQNVQAVDTASARTKKNGIDVERTHEIEEILNQITENQWTSLVGMAGIGKTHLAWQLGTTWCKNENWKLYFCDVSTCTTAPQLLVSLTETLNLTNSGADAFDLIVRVLNGTHPHISMDAMGVMLIIDNAETLDHTAINSLANLTKECPNIRLVVTTQRRLNTDIETIYQLNPMKLTDSIELFSSHCRVQLPSWTLTRENSSDVLELLNYLDRNPLSIELAAAYTSKVPLGELIYEIQSDSQVFERQSQESASFKIALEWSIQSLSEIERSVLSQVATLQYPFSMQIAEAIVKVPRGYATSNIIDILAQKNLINREYFEGQFLYKLLNSVQKAAVKQASKELVSQTHQQIAHYFSGLVTNHPTIHIEGHFLRLVSLNGPSKEASQCCVELLNRIKLCGPIDAGIELASSFLSRADIEELDRRPILLMEIDLFREQWNNDAILNKLMNIQIDISDSPEDTTQTQEIPISPFKMPSRTSSKNANHRVLYDGFISQCKWNHAIEVAKDWFQTASSQQQREILKRVIEDMLLGGRFSIALGTASHLEELELAHGNPNADTILQIAVLHTRLGNRTDALQRYKQALVLSKNESNPTLQGRIIGNRGLLHQMFGELDQALECYQESLVLFESDANKENIAAIHGNIGTVYCELEDYNQSIDYLDRAIHLTSDEQTNANKGIFIGNKGRSLIRLGKVNEGYQLLKDAVDICDQHQTFAADAFRGDIAVLLSKHGKTEAALRLIETAEMQLQDHIEQYGKFLCCKAEVLFRAHHHQGIREVLLKVESICRDLRLTRSSGIRRELQNVLQLIPPQTWLTESEIADRTFKADVLFRWGRLEEYSIRYSKSVEYLLQAEDIYRSLHIPDSIHRTQLIKASVLLLMGKLDIAHTMANEILQQYQFSNNKKNIGLAYNFLGKCLRRMGRLEEALQAYQQSIQLLTEFGSIESNLYLASPYQNAGNCCTLMGDYEQALQYLMLSLNHAIQNNTHTGNNYGAIGLCYQSMGKHSQALDFYHRAVNELRHIGDRSGETVYSMNIAILYQLKGRIDDAESLFKKSILMARESNVIINECIGLGNLGILFMHQQRCDEAKEVLIESIDLAKQCSPLCETVFSAALANVESALGNTNVALEMIQSIQPSSIENHIDEFIKLHCIMAEIYFRSGQQRQSDATLRFAEKLYEEHDFRRNTSTGDQLMRTLALLRPQDNS